MIALEFWKVEWWAQVWPNLAASVLWTIPALAWHHRRIKLHITRQIERAKDE